MNLKAYHDQLLFVPLGGTNEIGMNLNLYHYQGKWIMIDMGIGFADDYLPGIDVILPDIEFLADIRENLLALVLTHAHEDHLGAVPYLWDDLHCPIYATPFTASVLKAKLAAEGLRLKLPIHEVALGSQLELGPFALDFIALTHSIPEMQAIAIRTDKGVVMHTGDWKLDAAPQVGPVSDEDALRRYGDAGVLAMVCDSTNVFVEGESGSEETVRSSLHEVISACKQRVVVTTFASNIARVESIIKAGVAAGRKVVLAGRSLRRVIDAAQESGYLSDVPEFLSDKEAAGMSPDKLLILSTGCQGESRAALTRMIQGAHPCLRLASGDTVIFSSRVIPGNETRVRWMYNQMVLQGIQIITDKNADIHVSGHPARDELRRMYELVRPKVAVPTHGEAAHIREHAAFARSMGVKEVVQGRNGSVVQLSERESGVVDTVQSGYLAVDGTSIISITSPVIRTRRKLKEDGNITVSLVMDKDGGLMSRPQISAPGCLDAEEDEALLAELQDEVAEAVESLGKRAKITAIKDKARSALRKTISRELGKRPVLEVHIHHV
jgi:ribonuclease J